MEVWHECSGQPYNINGIHLKDLGQEMEAFQEFSNLIRNILGVPCLGTKEDQGGAVLRRHCEF